jgi:hypothetical protein
MPLLPEAFPPRWRGAGAAHPHFEAQIPPKTHNVAAAAHWVARAKAARQLGDERLTPPARVPRKIDVLTAVFLNAPLTRPA